MTDLANLPQLRDLGAHLQAVREDAALTRRQLSDDLSLKPGSVAAIERGDASTTTTTATRWLTACGLDDPDDINDWLDSYWLLFADNQSRLKQAFRTLSHPSALTNPVRDLLADPVTHHRAIIDAADQHLRDQINAVIAASDRLIARHRKRRP